jgi:beta-lactamase superfamily II metal-dependent hydrolase
MKKKFVRGSIILFFLIVVLLPFSSEKVNAATTSMSVYGIYMGENNGDATLIESKGRYLLMDLGTAEAYPYIKKFLDEKGVTKLSVYISHWHTDHTGGISVDGEDTESGFKQLLNDYEIERIFIPDETLYDDLVFNNDYYTQEGYTKLIDIEKMYELVRQYAKMEGCRAIEIKRGSKFSFGSVSAKVIGPIGVTLDEVSDYNDFAGAYVNNRSLVTKLTCGKTVYLNAGDIGSPQEKKLADKYGSSLKADIYKISHHGYWSSNTSNIIRYVKPTYSYATCDSTTENRYDSVIRTSHYGMTYMVGWEHQNICYQVKNNSIKVYTSDSASFGEPLSGWVKVYGGQEDNSRVYDYYYISKVSYKLLTGIRKISGRYYYFGTGGVLKTGTYDSSGNYDPWWSKRYINRGNIEDPSSYYLAIGLTQIGNDIYYFSSANGRYRVGTQLLSGKYYAFGSDGTLVRDQAYYSDGKLYGYADEYGVLKKGFYWLDGLLYYADKKGAIVRGSSSRTWTVKTLRGNSYAVNKDGHIRVSSGLFDEDVSFAGKNYTVDSQGLLTYKNPDKVVITSLKQFGNHFTVRWDQAQNATGYEVFICTKEEGYYTKVAIIKSGTQTYAYLKNLKPGKTYYVRVRAYAKPNGEKITGEYSDVVYSEFTDY